MVDGDPVLADQYKLGLPFLSHLSVPLLELTPLMTFDPPQ